jgi:hypothetical protein
MSGEMFSKRRKTLFASSDANPDGTVTYFDPDVCPIESNDPDEPLLLRQEYSRVTVALGTWVLALFWNGICGSIAYFGSRNGMPIFAMVIVGVFLALGVAILIGAVYKTLQLLNPVTTVVCSQRFLYPGSEFEVSWFQKGNVSRIKLFKLILEGEESATYRQGTSSRTETKKFVEKVIVETGDHSTMSRGFELVTLPEDTMHTFRASRNTIRWYIQVRGSIAFWPDMDDRFEIVIYPPKTGANYAAN